MSARHTCGCCITRRQCLKFPSLSALGAAAVEAAAKPKSKAVCPDYVDAAGLRPNPEVRVAATFLEMPRPYWLGWPGTTCELDKRQKEYGACLDKSVNTLGIKLAMEQKPVNDEAGVTAWTAKLKAGQPHGVLVMLQSIFCWKWAERVAKETGIPMLVFAPVGVAFAGHLTNHLVYWIGPMLGAAVAGLLCGRLLMEPEPPPPPGKK